MSPALRHECTRVPVTALASCGALLIAAEGPFLRFYRTRDLQLLRSIRVFKARAVHGIVVYSEEHHHVIKLVVWGAQLLRALEVRLAAHNAEDTTLDMIISNVIKASDWILDLSPRPTSLENESEYQIGTCAVVTAHNALLQVTIKTQYASEAVNSSRPKLSISDLTPSSRSILYSAHLFWESPDRLLVAAGTAFGEIVYWSWSQKHQSAPISSIHRVFLGHEGSIFGVQISKELSSGCCQQLRRVIASCSDDRTIRIWDVSDVDMSANDLEDDDKRSGESRAHHTGFINEAFDTTSDGISDCLAIGWGHMSRIWTVRFLESAACDGSLLLQSAGEDATARTWELMPSVGDEGGLPYKLPQIDNAAHHSGKNLWSSAVCQDSAGQQHILCGGADSKITMSLLPRAAQRQTKHSSTTVAEYTLRDVLSLAYADAPGPEKDSLLSVAKSSKKADFFRSYCFIDADTFLLTTNSGKVISGNLHAHVASGQSGLLSKSTLIAHQEDLSSYSVCTCEVASGVAFVAGANGSIYVYCPKTTGFTKLHSTNGKVGEMLSASISDSSGCGAVGLLVTNVGQTEALFLHVDVDARPRVSRTINVPIFEALTGSIVMSMSYVQASGTAFMFIGFRRGSIALYSVRTDGSTIGQATLFRIINKAHGDETVTSLSWKAASYDSPRGHLLSVGRDGCLAVHQIDLLANLVELVHLLTLPIGPSIEGLYFRGDHLLVHGFSSKKWVLYDVTTEEKIMDMETGGAHRSWAYQHHPSIQGGTLIWTRASSMHIYSQPGPSHAVLRTGGHGREIKAIAVSPESTWESRCRLIATGAEDTDIKIFQYVDGALSCRKTLRKHTTGIQHLQWSDDGNFLFSSGGCEEFYVWRVRDVPSFLEIGIVCEHVYAPESDYSDLRLMSFDVRKREQAFDIAMVFSDSSIKIYRYNPTAAVRWQTLARGIYFTCCLTQCMFLTSTRILTVGTDGHAVVWPLTLEVEGSSTTSTPVLAWEHPTRIHQNSSKAMVSQPLGDDTTLIVSGGDDGSLAFLLAKTVPCPLPALQASVYASPPMLVSCAHASAVTACAMVIHGSRLFLFTSGNDEWVRLWEVTMRQMNTPTDGKDEGGTDNRIAVRRLTKVKTNVADVSSMITLDMGNTNARLLLCGVGMEVIRVDWDDRLAPMVDQ